MTAFPLKKLTALLLAVASLFAFSVVAFGANETGENGNEAEKPVAVLLGDADGSGSITAQDARFVLRLAVGLEESNPQRVLVCDADKSGTVTAADARVVLRAAVGLENMNGETVEVELSALPVYQIKKGDESIFAVPTPVIPMVDVPSDSFVFTVYGNGHGVGMSQWGALFMARAGFDYKDILTYFYTGTTVCEDESYPEQVEYLGRYEESYKKYPTFELVCRIVYQEIYGLVDSAQPLDDEAVKAQAVAVLTLFKYHDFKGNYNNIGVARSEEDKIPDRLKNAVSSVMGEYVALANDENKRALETVYSCLHAGSSASSKFVWGGACSYLTSVKTPFEFFLAQQTDVFYHYPKGSSQNDIVDLSGKVIYSRNTDGKLVLDIREERQLEYFVQIHIYPRKEIEERLKKYAEEYNEAHKNDTVPPEPVIIPENPAQWFEILEHDGAFSPDCGFVNKIRVCNKILTGDRCLNKIVSFRSGCVTVEYNP